MNRAVQVTLDPDERRSARRRAAEQGLTLSEYVARLVRSDLAAWQPEAGTPASISIAEAAEAANPPDHEGTYIGEAVAERMKQTSPTQT